MMSKIILFVFFSLFVYQYIDRSSQVKIEDIKVLPEVVNEYEDLTTSLDYSINEIGTKLSRGKISKAEALYKYLNNRNFLIIRVEHYRPIDMFKTQSNMARYTSLSKAFITYASIKEREFYSKYGITGKELNELN